MVPVEKRFNPASPSHLEQKSSEIPRRLPVVTKIGANELRGLQGKAIPHQVTIHNGTFTEEVNLGQCRFEPGLDLAGNTQANREFDAPPVTGRRQKWALTQQAFDSLLAYLGPDRNTAAQKYIDFRRNLVRFFEWRGCSAPEDYADEVMNRGAKRIAEGEDIRDPAMYLVGIARIFLLENRHQHAREQPVSEVLVQSKTTPYEIEYDRDQRVVCLRRCLQQVSPEGRQLILLYYEGDKSEKINNRKKLMERLKIPANTLRARALRIRERLQSCVEQCMNKRTSS
jgi:DNA-directed RNA polymerase specialized sigma24 family protein